MAVEIFQGDPLQGGHVGCLKHDRRRDTSVERLLPALCAKTPSIARPQTIEPKCRLGSAQVIAHILRKGEELVRHADTYGMHPEILRTGVAAAISIKTRQGVEAARFEFSAQDVLWHGRYSTTFFVSSWFLDRDLTEDHSIGMEGEGNLASAILSGRPLPRVVSRANLLYAT